MQKQHDNQSAIVAHRRIKTSTTLNRKYVQRPVKVVSDAVVAIKKSPKVSRFGDQQSSPKQQIATTQEEPITPATTHPLQASANTRLVARRERNNSEQTTNRPTAKQLKDQAIRKALADAEKQSVLANQIDKEKKVSKKSNLKLHFSFPRVALALSCTLAAVFAIVYFVNLNMPDISLRVAAMQSGFDASYPSYVPRGFRLSGIVSEDEKIILNFENRTDGLTFSLTEEKSSWDSDALLNNYVKRTYGDNYSLVRERGLAIYVSDDSASWVNGGVLYKIGNAHGTLTKKQLCAIATSL